MTGRRHTGAGCSTPFQGGQVSARFEVAPAAGIVALVEQDHAQGVQTGLLVGMVGEDRHEHLARFGQTPLSVQQAGQVVLGAGLITIDVERLAVQMLRLAELARAVRGQRLLKQRFRL